MDFVKNLAYKTLCLVLALSFCAGLVTVSRASDGDIDIPMGDLVDPTNPTVPSDPDVINSGSYGTLTWVLHANGLLVITGTGPMPQRQAPWYEDRGLVKSVQIGQGVTTVSDQAFYNCTRMESIQLPQGLESIGYGAFAGCSSLKSVSIPSTVTSIGAAAFGFCSGLTAIQLPLGMTDIQERTFAQCVNLASVTLRGNIKAVYVGAFDGCDALDTVYYYGNADMWDEISIAAENDALVNAARFYNEDEILRGDMNGDYRVDDADALYLLRYTLFPVRFPINQSGDVNGDGVENDADALYLLRYTLFPARFPLK